MISTIIIKYELLRNNTVRLISKIKDKYPIIWSILFIVVGIYLFYNIFFIDDALFSLILFVSSTYSMYLVIKLWKWFTPKYAPQIIKITSEHKLFRKLIAGGSFSYYEYNPNPEKIGMFEPITRFINLMIAFLGISTTFAKLVNFKPESPVADLNATIIWALLILLVPIILTPIIPIIWAMEDLKLKAWNNKNRTNWRISVKYKNRFNSFIALGTLSVGLALTKQEGLDWLQNITIFARVLFSGILLLIYPVSILTFLYYIYFRGKIHIKVKELMNLPTAETDLIYYNPITKIPDIGKNKELMDIFDKAKQVSNLDDEQKELQSIDIESNQEEGIDTTDKDSKKTEKEVKKSKNIISSTTRVVRNTTLNLKRKTIGRLNKKRKTKKKKGSATEGLWD